MWIKRKGMSCLSNMDCTELRKVLVLEREIYRQWLEDIEARIKYLGEKENEKD